MTLCTYWLATRQEHSKIFQINYEHLFDDELRNMRLLSLFILIKLLTIFWYILLYAQRWQVQDQFSQITRRSVEHGTRALTALG